MGRARELFELTRVRVLLFVREPELLFWVFAFPLILAAVLGFAFQNTGAATSPVGVLDADGELAAALARTDGVEVVALDQEDEAGVELRGGRIDALVLAGDPPRVRLDPSRAESELARLRIERAVALLERGPDAADEGRAAVEPITERGSRYVDFLFPGLLGMNLMGTGMWAIGLAVAELRQKRVLKRMLVTPMRRSSFLLSLMLARLVFLAAEVLVLVGFGTWLLDVPFRANVFSFALLCLVGATAFAGLGVLVASRVQTIQGASGILNLAMMPMWLGSGVFFSYERFPEAAQPVLRVLPLTALNDALRALELDGAGLLHVLPELGILAAWGIAGFAVGLRIFRWR